MVSRFIPDSFKYARCAHAEPRTSTPYPRATGPHLPAVCTRAEARRQGPPRPVTFAPLCVRGEQLAAATRIPLGRRGYQPGAFPGGRLTCVPAAAPAPASSLVAKAAEDSEVPTAGYLQEELKKLTLEPDSCVGVEDALLARLEKRSSNVKLKTLRLIKLLCESGSPNFRRDMQRRIKEVRDCLHWQGDPHPTMGDLPNKMVREAAQQVSRLARPSASPLRSFFGGAIVNSVASGVQRGGDSWHVRPALAAHVDGCESAGHQHCLRLFSAHRIVWFGIDNASCSCGACARSAAAGSADAAALACASAAAAASAPCGVKQPQQIHRLWERQQQQHWTRSQAARELFLEHPPPSHAAVRHAICRCVRLPGRHCVPALENDTAWPGCRCAVAALETTHPGQRLCGVVDVCGECADAAAASLASAPSLTAPGNTFSLMSDGLKSLSTKFAGVSNSNPKPSAQPQPAAGGGGGGSYMGPSALEGGQGGVARQDSAANAVAAVEAVSAQRAAGATGFDRYGRPLGGGAHGSPAAGDLDLGTINEIIANLEGGGAAGSGQGVSADASAQSVPSGAAPLPQPLSPGQPGASSLGLVQARPAPPPPPADDDARCKLCQ